MATIERKKGGRLAGEILKTSVPFVLVFAFFSLGLPPQASATHFRYGHLNWKPRPDVSSTDIEFRLTAAFRRDGYSGLALDGYAQVGDTITEVIGGTDLCFGDGVCIDDFGPSSRKTIRC